MRKSASQHSPYSGCTCLYRAGIAHPSCFPRFPYVIAGYLSPAYASTGQLLVLIALVKSQALERYKPMLSVKAYAAIQHSFGLSLAWCSPQSYSVFWMFATGAQIKGRRSNHPHRSYDPFSYE